MSDREDTLFSPGVRYIAVYRSECSYEGNDAKRSEIGIRDRIEDIGDDDDRERNPHDP